jgi:hypothetical protein
MFTLTDLIRRFRGLAIAIVVLAMSAGIVFATGPLAQPSGGTTPSAEDPSTGTDEDASEAPETEEPSEAPATEAPATEAPETEEPSEDADTDKDADADADAAEGDTHGALVSAAAKMETPEGFRNHGAFVSCVAHMKDATLATIDWTTVTPEACAATKPGKGQDADKQAAKDAAKAERDAAKAERKAARDAAKAERKAAHGH